MVGLERRNTTFLLDRRCLVEYACITKKTCVGLRDVPGKGGVRLSALPPDLFFFFFLFGVLRWRSSALGLYVYLRCAFGVVYLRPADKDVGACTGGFGCLV